METVEKIIAGVEYRKIDGSWHQLSRCGFLWVECNASTLWIVEGWIN